LASFTKGFFAGDADADVLAARGLGRRQLGDAGGGDPAGMP
jgi:hypothetical protein